jgi:TonB family protein
MITTWMLYAALISALIAIAALALERVAVVQKIPIRFIWLASTIASVAWPIANAMQRLMAANTPVRMMPFTITLEPTRVIANSPIGPDRAVLIDRALIVFWVALSALLLARLCQAIITLRRTRNHWRAAEVDGMSVRLSTNVGPAVVGLRSMDVVLPEWIMTLDEPLRALVLRHEHEHRMARDPYLLLVSAIAVAIMPWNLALWFQARRLRLAIEVDCDARVLRAHPSPERYGLLMLTIAQRRSAAPPMFAPMLSEPTSQLERRIIAMRTTTRRLARVTVVGGAVVAVSVLVFACALQSDNPVAPRPSVAAPIRVAGGPIPVNDNQTYFEFQVEQAVSPAAGTGQPRYPDMLRSANVEGEVLAQFVVDTTGVADMSQFKVLKSTHDMFTAAVREALPTMRFHPALVGGRPVKQLVQMPFRFDLSKGVKARAPLPYGSKDRDRITVTAPGVRRVAQPEYKEFKLSKQATPTEDAPRPRYPDILRAANVEGEVLVQFVVEANGRPNAATLKVLRSTHEQFTESVRKVLPQMQFNPALVGDIPVKQLVTMPFTFSLPK